MYIGQQVGYRLKELADAFAVAHVGTISYALTQVRQLLGEDIRLAKQLAGAGAARGMVVIQ